MGKQNIHDLVTSAGDCMNLGDKADRFIRTLRERYRALEAQRKAIRNVMDDRKSEYNGLRERESKLRSDVAIAT